MLPLISPPKAHVPMAVLFCFGLGFVSVQGVSAQVAPADVSKPVPQKSLADRDQVAPECPLMAQSGHLAHSGHVAQPGHSEDGVAPAGSHAKGMRHSEGMHPAEPTGLGSGVEPAGSDGVRFPQELGQSAFAAISEIVEAVTGDPSTDWDRVDIDRLRRHLIDMDLVMVRSQVDRRDLANGFEALVTGDAETAGAIHRMLGAHAAMMQGEFGWRVEIEERPDGALLRVTSEESTGARRLRALGFAGFLTSGNHHGMHHWALATGEHPHHPPSIPGDGVP